MYASCKQVTLVLAQEEWVFGVTSTLANMSHLPPMGGCLSSVAFCQNTLSTQLGRDSEHKALLS